jgi:4-hydroxy-3-methylbut-2-enyl diphosphate reductase
MTNPLVVVAALRAEYLSLLGTDPSTVLERCGMGPAKVAQWLPRLQRLDPGALAVAGVAGGLDPGLRPGDVVVATEVRDGVDRVALRGAAPLVAELRRLGLRVRSGPIVSTDHIVTSWHEREKLAASGAIAVDMESASLVRAAQALPGQRPIAVVRVVADTAYTPIARLRTVPAGAKALSTLRQVGRALGPWAALAGPRTVVLAGPRSFCAGVERAIDIVNIALQRYPHPVYVRRQIVHNAHIVKDFERRGVVFVDELEQVPDNTTVVFSAHGVAPAVRAEAERRGLNAIDATCPLVAKVHSEAKRFVGRGEQVLLVGHAGHDEVEGTLGEAPGQIRLVQDAAEAAAVEVDDPSKVAFVLQTTLGVDEAAATVAELRRRFPLIESSPTDDICYATTNRQRAVQAVIPDCDLLLVIGSANSSNSLRLVEVAEAAGTEAHLIEDATEILPAWLRDARRVGITAGASAPPHLVDELVEMLRSLGPVNVDERVIVEENLTFTLPRGVSG